MPMPPCSIRPSLALKCTAGRANRHGKTSEQDDSTARARWERTHEEGLDEVCYSYCYYFGLIAVDPKR